MSFILDALKKSESDRQRKAHPESAFIAAQPADRKPGRWVWVVAALLGVNVIVLVIFMITVKKPAPQVIAAPTQDIESTGTDDSTFRDRVAEARKARVTEPRPYRQALRTEATVPLATESVSVPVQSATTPEPENVPPSTMSIEYKTFNEARVEGNFVLPDMHLDIHVYSKSAADRFVFINMNKYKEHAVMSEGPRVVEIVPDGAILEYSGTRFLLPRD